MKNLVLRTALMCSILFSAVAARADLASIYAAGKLDQVSVQGMFLKSRSRSCRWRGTWHRIDRY